MIDSIAGKFGFNHFVPRKSRVRKRQTNEWELSNSFLLIASDITGLQGVVFQSHISLLDSLIVRKSPPLFNKFGAKHFNLLWQGNCDSFTVQEFHHRCDGRADSFIFREICE
jgi:hypothetical protein